MVDKDINKEMTAKREESFFYFSSDDALLKRELDISLKRVIFLIKKITREEWEKNKNKTE